MRQTSWRMTGAAVAVALGLLCGCDGRQFGEVEGTVSVDGKPLPDVEVVFARGTTEPPGVGGTGQAFVDALRSQLGGRSLGVYAVDYPASREFDTSTPAGASDASGHIESMVANCPNTRLVLGGYSQGAGVIHLATTAMPSDVAEHVADLDMSDADDDAILNTAQQRDSIVVTFDADFHQLMAVSGARSPSVIRIRMERLKGDQVAAILKQVISAASTELVAGAVVSVTPSRIRVRALPVG